MRVGERGGGATSDFGREGGGAAQPTHERHPATDGGSETPTDRPRSDRAPAPTGEGTHSPRAAERSGAEGGRSPKGGGGTGGTRLRRATKAGTHAAVAERRGGAATRGEQTKNGAARRPKGDGVTSGGRRCRRRQRRQPTARTIPLLVPEPLTHQTRLRSPPRGAECSGAPKGCSPRGGA